MLTETDMKLAGSALRYSVISILAGIPSFIALIVALFSLIFASKEDAYHAMTWFSSLGTVALWAKGRAVDQKVWGLQFRTGISKD